MKSMNSAFKIDRISFELGMINCFVEMVACGVKRLAISPPIPPEDYKLVGPESDKVVRAFKIKSYLDKSLLITDLQPEEFTRGKWCILYYEDDSVLKAYLALKERKKGLEKTGHLNPELRKEIAREFGRLLSYPEEKIKEMIKEGRPDGPFMLIKDEE